MRKQKHTTLSNSVIVIFTKDRPTILFKTLDSIKDKNIPIIVLDDSSLVKNRVAIQKKIGVISNVVYHGKEDQDRLVQEINVENKITLKFVNKLGTKKWNLGYARNYAILLAKKMNFKEVLFMDDDIIVEDDTLIQNTFKNLSKYDFVGARVTGMIDDSMIGYIVRELNYPPEEYFSGGFIAFKLSIITNYFINRYNEDWIWLYLHQISSKFLLLGEVKQLPYDNFKNAIKKAKRQELGEIMIDGVKEAYNRRNFNLLKNEKFWKKMLIEKQEYYNELQILSIEENRPDLHKILLAVKNYSAKFNENIFVDIFNHYFKEKQEWSKILNSI